MRKASLIILFSICVLFLKVSPVYAAIITINPEGEVVWNVLSLQDEFLVDQEVEDFAVRKVAEVNSIGNDVISVEQENGKVKLSVGTGEATREVDVDKVEDTLIEIEERPALYKLTIGKSGDEFTINQGSTTVKTSLPIQVNPKSARLSLRTSSGDNFLYVMPNEALRGVLRSKVLTTIRNAENMELVDNEKGLVYKIPGEKIIPIFDLYNYSFKVDTYVSAQTGELLDVNAPTWFKIFGFLITQEI